MREGCIENKPQECLMVQLDTPANSSPKFQNAAFFYLAICYTCLSILITDS